MSLLEQLPIRRRLGLGFTIIIVLMVILTTVGINKVNIINNTLTEITDINSVKQRYAINYRGSVHDRAIAVRDVALATDQALLEDLLSEIKELERFYSDSELKMRAMMNEGSLFSAEEKRILSKIDDVQAKTLPLVKEIITLRQQNKISEAKTLVLQKARPFFIQWLKVINEFIDYQEQVNQTATPIARKVAESFQTLMLVMCGIAIVIGILVASVISRSLHRSLGGEPYEAAHSLSEIAQGNLRIHSKQAVQGSILDSVYAMQQKLTQTLNNIASSTEQLTSQTTTVNEGSEQALSSARSQAELTLVTTERLDEMKNGLKQVSDIAIQTQSNSKQTSEFSEQGKCAINESASEMQRIAATVDNTVEQIRKLETTTSEIGDIVSVISGISDQTNLLALNAAIEAARAGESGRGFAVVADEVRQLAQRTNEATEQIERMIIEVQKETSASVSAMEKTQPLVENGRSLTNKATELLQQIEQQANDSLHNVQAVTQAATEQVSSIATITDAMEQINQMSKNSITALVENNKATDSLQGVAQNLTQSVAYFKF